MDKELQEPTYLTVGDIFRLVFRGKFVIVSVVLVCITAAFLVSALSEKVYRATYRVTAADDDGSNSLSSAFSQIPLLGGQAQRPDFTLYQSLLTSERMGRAIAARPEFSAELLPPGWDKDLEPGADRGTIAALTVAGYLSNNLSVSTTQFPSQYAVVLDHKNPRFALDLLKYLHVQANDIARTMRNSRALTQRQHLRDQLAVTAVADYRQMLLQLLSRVESQIMTSSVQGEFAAKIVDGPFVSPTPVFPRTRLFLIMAVAGGGMLGMLLVVFTPLSDALVFGLFRRRTRAVTHANN